MNFIALHFSKQPGEHIEEVNPNVGRQSSGLLDVAFPRAQVPLPPLSQIGQLQLVFVLPMLLLNFLAQCDQGRVDSQL
jgi:hypothetical protein